MKITSTDPSVQRMLDDMEIKVQMTADMVREFFSLQMDKATDQHLAAIVNEIHNPDKYGTEVSDLLVNSISKYTDIGYVSIRGELDIVVLLEVSKRWKKNVNQ